MRSPLFIKNLLFKLSDNTYMNAIEHAVKLLKNGKLVAIPTETVYGLGADARNPTALQNIYVAKGRPATNPLIIHIPNPDAITEWATDIPDEAWQLAASFWPGPLTLILQRRQDVSQIITGGQDTVALRVPNHPITLELLRRFDGGIAAPSANRYGRISPTTAAHVAASLGAKVDYILEGGPCAIGIESTIVSLLGSSPVILRQGSISSEALSNVLGKAVSDSSHQPKMITPGSSASHYAPLQPLYLLEKNHLFETALKLMEENNSFSALSFSEKPSEFNLEMCQWICAPLNPAQYAQQLYDNLHSLDKINNICILVEVPPDTKEWLAIKDRLQRASRPNLRPIP